MAHNQEPSVTLNLSTVFFDKSDLSAVVCTLLFILFTAPASAPLTARTLFYPPSVEAGDDQILPLGVLSTTLTAVINDDTNPGEDGTVTTNWNLISGQSGVILSTPAARETDVTLPEPGRYVFELSETDGAATVKDTVTVFAFDTWSSTEDHDADGTPSGDGADAYTQGGQNSANNYGAFSTIAARNWEELPIKSIIRIDLSALSGQDIENALLQFEISTPDEDLIEDWTYNVFGLYDGDPDEDWLEGTGTRANPSSDGVAYESLPGNSTVDESTGGAYEQGIDNSGGASIKRTTFLGTFSTRRGRREKVHLATTRLARFLNDDRDGQVSFLITRVTFDNMTISFAAKEHPEFAAPRLWVDYGVAPLPITLTHFRAARNKDDARLSWRATEAVDFSHFELQRSEFGSEWTTFATVGEDEEYVSADAGAGLRGKEQLLYRIKMVDLDGSFAYSPVRTVRFDTQSLVVFPNPFSEAISVRSPRSQLADLFDVTGVRVNQLRLTEGHGTYPLPDLPRGLYTLYLPASGKSIRIIKK